MEMAVANLLQNAIDFSPPDGKITVEIVSEDSRNPAVALRVLDEGKGLPEFAIDRAFDRFYSHRPDKDSRSAHGRKSSGLGLCFVREAAELHGGKARIGNRKDQSGAVAELTIPV